MFQTLRAKLLAFFLLTTFIPLIFIGYISYHSQKQELTKQIEHSLLIHSNHLAKEAENLLTERIRDIHLLVESPIFEEENFTEQQLKKQFQNFLDVYDVYSDVIFVNSNGVVSTSMIDQVVGKNLSSREWFHASMEGDVFISDIYLSPVLNSPVLVMSAPVRNKNGEIIGVLSPSFDLNHLWQGFDNFTNQKQMVDLDGYAFLINVKGEVIAHPDRQKILSSNYLVKHSLMASDLIDNSKNQKIYYNDAEETVVSFAHIKKIDFFSNDWFIGISVSEDQLFAPLKELLKNYLIFMALILFLTTMGVIKLAAYIVTPVEKLVAATTEFGVGKQVSPLPENSYQEINRLNGTFSSMVQKLEERERGHRKSTLIIETTDNGVMAINKHSLIVTMFNHTCEKLFKVSKKEVIGTNISDVVTQSYAFQQFITGSDLLNYLHTEEVKSRFEFQCQLSQKTYHFFISISSLPKLDDEDEHEELLVVINDLTEKRQMERELVRSEKLKVVGEMAAGLAHEIRNPLAIIRGFIQLFSQGEEEDAKRGYYNIIVKEIDRVNQFIMDLLNIANPRASCESKESNLLDLIEDLLVLQKTQLENKGILINKDFTELPPLFIDPNKFKQVCINIIQNAMEAMKNSGTLTIGTKVDTDNNVVILYFQDTGLGMDQSTIEKLGTPFYTTKESGTGLGLTTSFRIIEEMKGSVNIESEIGKGSTFIIKLPINGDKP